MSQESRDEQIVLGNAAAAVGERVWRILPEIRELYERELGTKVEEDGTKLSHENLRRVEEFWAGMGYIPETGRESDIVDR